MNHLLNLILVLSLGLFVNTNSFDVVTSELDNLSSITEVNTTISSEYSLNVILNSNNEEEFDEIGSYVQCNCAAISWSFLGGNKDCLANNRGSSCAGGINYDCSIANGNCG